MKVYIVLASRTFEDLCDVKGVYLDEDKAWEEARKVEEDNNSIFDVATVVEREVKE